MTDDHDFGPELREFPRGIPVSPQMQAQMNEMAFAPAATLASKTLPVREQTKLNPGDWAITLTAVGPTEDDFCVVQLLDHLEYTANFPNYEKRALKNWVLCRWASHQDHEREPEPSYHLGWFELARLIPLTEERAQESLAAIVDSGTRRNGNLENSPEWLEPLYNQWVDKMNAASPTTMLAPATCGKCQSRKVELHGRQTTSIGCQAAIMEVDGKTTFVNGSAVVPKVEQKAHLHCKNCGARKNLDSEEYHLHH